MTANDPCRNVREQCRSCGPDHNPASFDYGTHSFSENRRQTVQTYSRPLWRLSNIAQESLSGVRIVKSFVKEHYFFEKFEVTNTEYKNAIMNLVKTSGFFFPFITFLSGLSTVLLILFGGNAAIHNKMTPGSIIAMLSYLEMLVWPMMSAGFTVISCSAARQVLKESMKFSIQSLKFKNRPVCRRKTLRRY
jgi:ABC-type multidrug transport system fused ATPase/permease subunit